MPLCPECGDEFQEGYTVCPSCQVLLVDAHREPLDASDIDASLEGRNLITVFVSNLENCKERHRTLLESDIPSLITRESNGMIEETGHVFMALQVAEEDIPAVMEIFEEVWDESLDIEGLQELNSDLVDLEQEMILCPGCGEEVEELVDGECPECGLFLGIPDEGEGSDEY